MNWLTPGIMQGTYITLVPLENAFSMILDNQGHIPIVLQDAISNQQLASHCGRSSFAKARNRITIPALLLNQNAHIACNLLLISSHLEVRWVYHR